MLRWAFVQIKLGYGYKYHPSSFLVRTFFPLEGILSLASTGPGGQGGGGLVECALSLRIKTGGGYS